MQAYFVAFIKSGDPNGGAFPRWPAYSSGERMIIGVPPRAEQDKEADRRRAVDSILIDRR
jgi:carboxylesterase type B